MKQSRRISILIMTLIVILLTCYLLFLLSEVKVNNPKTPKSIAFFEVQLKSLPIDLRLAVKMQTSLQKSIAFPIQGWLESGEIQLKPGSHFKKGQLLFTLNNEDAFKHLVQTKKNLVKRVRDFWMNAAWMDAENKQIWNTFEQSIAPNKLLEPFPKTSLITENRRVEIGDLEKLYTTALQEERLMQNYFLLASSNGVISEMHVQVGQYVHARQVLATYRRSNRCELVVELDSSTFCSFEKINSVDLLSQGKRIPLEWSGKSSSFLKGKMVLKWSLEKMQLENKAPDLHLVLKGVSKVNYAVVPCTFVHQNSFCIDANSKHKIPVLIEKKIGDSLVVLGLKSKQKIQKFN